MKLRDLRELLGECVSLARDMGYEGSADDYNYTENDLNWVVKEFGRKPTKEEWKEAGLNWVGGTHVQDS